jgi:hypothetical protein
MVNVALQQTKATLQSSITADRKTNTPTQHLVNVALQQTRVVSSSADINDTVAA